MILNMITQWSWAWSCIGSYWACAWSYFRGLHCDLSRNEWMTCKYLSTHTVYWYKIVFPLFGGYGHHYWKMDPGKHNFHEIFNWAKRLKNCWTSSRHMPIAIAKCTLTGLVPGWEILSEVSEIWSCACVFTQHCFFLPPSHMPAGI